MKKLLALVLALVMSMSLVTISNAAFKDADTIDNKEAVDVMNAIGVLVGDEKGNFNAKDNLTRAQAAKIVCVMLLGKDASDALSLKSNFTDVSGWAESYIAYCASQGIVAGVGDGKFDPNGKLTGYQFAKMLLVALGYDAELESMIGSDWQVNVAKLAISAGLTDGLNIALSKVITRDEAAKMAFNTLKATMVAYTNGTKVETGDGTKVTVNATRYYVEKTGGDGYKQNGGNDNYMQFCEQYFSKLKLNTQGRTDLDRPANEWVYQNKTIGAYAKSAAVTYTANMNTDNGKKTVKVDLKNYYYKNLNNDGVSSDGNVAASTIDSYEDAAALTGNGRVVEIFVTDNIITDIIANDSKLVEVKKVTKDEVTFKTSGVNAVEDDDDLYGFFSKLEKGDKAVVVLDSNQDVIEAYEPTKVTGKFTKIKGDDFTVGGEKYQAAKDVNAKATLKADNLDNTYTLTLDKYGYILAVGDEDVADDTFAFVLDTSANVNKGNYDYAVKLLFTDGTTKWVDVSEVNNDVIADGDVSADDFADLKNFYVTYTEKDGKYDITSKTSETKKAQGAITKGTSTILSNGGTSYTASNKTIFIVKKNSNYTVYTGIKNVPSMTVAADKAFVYNDNGIAKIVYITASATTSNEDQVFIYSTDIKGTEKDGSTVVNYYKAIVNGEDTTIGVKSGETVAVGLYVNNSYTNEYISKLGTKYVADTDDATSIKVFNQATDGLSDITLKNGILKVSATSAASYVTADEFNSYIVKGTSAKSDTLALDSGKTFGASDSSEGYALADGDYAVIILDDDGYVTDLYLFDKSL